VTAEPLSLLDHLARLDDPPTSHRAAASVRDREGDTIRPGTHRALMLGAYVHAADGLADHQAAQACGLYRAHVCYWHRATDLLHLGYLEETGRTVVNADTGRARRVLRITAAGLDAWQAVAE
jgi:hypothetical protein